MQKSLFGIGRLGLIVFLVLSALLQPSHYAAAQATSTLQVASPALTTDAGVAWNTFLGGADDD